MTSIKYGNRTIELNDMPESNVTVLVQRTVNHILQNEVSAKVKNWKDAYTKENGTEPDEDEVAEQTEAFRDEQWTRITEGDLTLRSSGPRGTAIETLMREIATKRVRLAAKAAKITLPKKATDTIDVRGIGPQTMAQLVQRRLDKEGDDIRAAAERQMADDAKAVEAASDVF